MDTTKAIIARGKFTVNKSSLSGSVITGKIKIDPNHPAERLLNHPDRTNAVSLSSIFTTKLNLT